MLLGHAGQLHTMDLVGLTLSVVAAAIPGYVIARNAVRRRQDAMRASGSASPQEPG